MITMRQHVAGTIAAAAGAAGWLSITLLTHRREAWDSELYFTAFLPLIAVLIGALAFVAPDRSWRWAFAPFGGQAVVAFVQNPTANLMPLGLIVFAFYGALCLVPSTIGAWLRRRLDR
jgi:hypothetical protein